MSKIEIVRLDRHWPGGAGSRNGMVRLELQPVDANGALTADTFKFDMTPGQALELIMSLSRAAKEVLKGQVA